MSDNETIADIIAEMRSMGNYQRYSGDHARVLANRLEAAHKRERGNAAKLREALAPFPSLCEWLVENAAKLGIPDMVAKLRERGDKARAALSAPPRNCDRFASAEEAIEYHKRTNCAERRYCAYHDGCPTDGSCVVNWLYAEAQEGGAK